MEISGQKHMENTPLKISLYFAHNYVESELVLKDKYYLQIDKVNLFTQFQLIRLRKIIVKQIIKITYLIHQHLLIKKMKSFLIKNQ